MYIMCVDDSQPQTKLILSVLEFFLKLAFIILIFQVPIAHFGDIVMIWCEVASVQEMLMTTHVDTSAGKLSMKLSGERVLSGFIFPPSIM